MEELHSIEKCLISQVQAQCGDLKKEKENYKHMNVNYYMEGNNS